MRNGDQATYAAQVAVSWEVPYPGEVTKKSPFICFWFISLFYLKRITLSVGIKTVVLKGPVQIIGYKYRGN